MINSLVERESIMWLCKDKVDKYWGFPLFLSCALVFILVVV